VHTESYMLTEGYVYCLHSAQPGHQVPSTHNKQFQSRFLPIFVMPVFVMQTSGLHLKVQFASLGL